MLWTPTGGAQQTITGTRSEATEAIDVDGTGNTENHDLVFVADITDFTGSTVPDERETVKVDGVNYYVATTMPDQAGVAVTFGLNRNNDV